MLRNSNKEHLARGLISHLCGCSTNRLPSFAARCCLFGLLLSDAFLGKCIVLKFSELTRSSGEGLHLAVEIDGQTIGYAFRTLLDHRKTGCTRADASCCCLLCNRDALKFVLPLSRNNLTGDYSLALAVHKNDERATERFEVSLLKFSDSDVSY